MVEETEKEINPAQVENAFADFCAEKENETVCKCEYCKSKATHHLCDGCFDMDFGADEFTEQEHFEDEQYDLDEEE